jgi:hypothetical protein
VNISVPQIQNVPFIWYVLKIVVFEARVDIANTNAKQYQECNTLVTRIEVRIMRDYKGT